MYAIIEVAGKQYKVEKNGVVNVDRLEKKENEDFNIDSVIMYSDGSDVKIGQPYLKDVKVVAEYKGESKGKKVRGIVFKKRKNYERTIGHREYYSKLLIKDIVVG
jgi:large subunit ribosomal protein L21